MYSCLSPGVLHPRQIVAIVQQQRFVLQNSIDKPHFIFHLTLIS